MNCWNPLFTLLACAISFASFGTHVRGGQISVEQLPGSLTCKITLTIYTDTESPVPVGGAQTDVMYIRGVTGRPVVYTIPEITRNNIPPGATYTMISDWLRIGVVTYELHHTFSSYG